MGAPDCFKWNIRRLSSTLKINKVLRRTPRTEEPKFILPSNLKYYLAGLWESDDLNVVNFIKPSEASQPSEKRNESIFEYNKINNTIIILLLLQ